MTALVWGQHEHPAIGEEPPYSNATPTLQLVAVQEQIAEWGVRHGIRRVEVTWAP
jgi:hypothetical protein